MYKVLTVFILGLLLASCQEDTAIKPLVEKKNNTIVKDSTSLVTNDDPPINSGNGRP
jgi:PBP1b-binding outer membrane lipoprotein LpoB